MEYCKVRLTLKAPENLDPVENFNGKVTFTPDTDRGDVWNNGDSLTPSVRIDATIVDNDLQGSDGKKLVSLFAGGPGVNPEKVYWRIAFDDLYVGDQRVHIDPFVFEAIPGAVLDLEKVTPVAGYTPPGIIRGEKGEPGFSFKGVFNEESELPLDNKKGDAWANLSSKDLYVWNGSKWEVVTDFGKIDVGLENINEYVKQAEQYSLSSKATEDRVKATEDRVKATEDRVRSDADRAEFAAEETIQQVEGDFATRNYVDSTRWQRRYLTEEDDIDLFFRDTHSGAWRVGMSSVSTALSLPTTDRGSLHVYHTAGSVDTYANAVQMWMPSGAPSLWMRTIQTGGSWTEWREIGGSSGQEEGSKFIGYPDYANSIVRTDKKGKLAVSTGTITDNLDVVNKDYVDSASFARGTLTTSHDIDKMADRKYAGAWQVTSTPVAESLGVPVPGFGTFLVFWAAGSSEPYYTATQWWVPAASGDMFKRSIISRGSWSSWSLIGGNNKDEEVKQTASISASTGRADLLRASRGGRIGTGGKAVVSLRFDHNLAAFDSNILTRLRARQLPATMAFYYDMISPVDGYSNDDSAAAGKTWDGAQQNFYRGVEVFSHSYSHQDADTLEKMRREIVESRTALESAMPDVRVHGWAMPGIGGSQYMGWWSAWVDPETRLTHPAGQMLGATYGTYNVSGYGLNELGKAQTRYFGVESHTTAAASKGHIDLAIATGTGLTLMWHPNQIGADGKMSLAVFDEILDYIVAKRDAGEIMVLTIGGQAVADPSTDWRHSLVPDVEGWSGSPSGTLTYDLNLSYLHDSAGAVRMLEAEVEGTGNVRLTAQDRQSNAPINVYQTQSFSGGGTARLAVGIPRRSSSLRLILECTGTSVRKVGFYGA